MFCSKCGKDISDESKFCYSCGSKVEIKEKQEIIIDTPPLVVDQETHLESIDSLQPTLDQEKDHLSSSSELPASSKVKDLFLRSSLFLWSMGWGWLILVAFYMIYILNSTKIYSLTSVSIMTFGFIIIIVFYFWLRNYLSNKNIHIQKMTSSFISGIISFFLIGLLTSGSIGLIEGYQKRSEIMEFMNNFQKQIEILKKQELEYSKMMEYEPKTESELKDKISKIDEYKVFLTKKDKYFISLINFIRETNSKYKKKTSVDEQVTKLEKVFSGLSQKSIISQDIYKKYLITGDEKYYNIYDEEYKKSQLGQYEIKKLMTDVLMSL